MLDFVDVATFFDDAPTHDWYTGDFLFYAQYNSFDESSVDGAVVRKRTMSLHPTITPPARYALNVVGEGWLMGWGALDTFQGEAVRKSYWLKKITNSATLLTPAEVCTGAAGTNMAVNLDFLKFTVDGANTSDYFPFWEFYTGSNEVPTRGKYFKIGTTYYRIRVAALEDSGLLCSQADELDSGSVVSVTIGGSTYDPVLDEYIGVPTTTNGIMFSTTKLYKLVTTADPLNQAGDMTLIMVNDVAVGSTVTVAGKDWQVIAKVPEVDAYSYHIRGN